VEERQAEHNDNVAFDAICTLWLNMKQGTKARFQIERAKQKRLNQRSAANHTEV